MGLVESVGARLRRAGLQGRTINLKVRFGDFHTITRSRSLPGSTADTSEIWATARELLAESLPSGFAVRLIGIGVSGFDHPETGQQDLFRQVPTSAPLDELSDAINQRFGKQSLRRGTSVRKTT